MSVDTKLTNAEHSMRPIRRNTVKMVAEHRDDTAGLEDYSAVDKSCMVVAADPLSLIAVVRSAEVGGRSRS